MSENDEARILAVVSISSLARHGLFPTNNPGGTWYDVMFYVVVCCVCFGMTVISDCRTVLY